MNRRSNARQLRHLRHLHCSIGLVRTNAHHFTLHGVFEHTLEPTQQQSDKASPRQSSTHDQRRHLQAAVPQHLLSHLVVHRDRDPTQLVPTIADRALRMSAWYRHKALKPARHLCRSAGCGLLALKHQHALWREHAHRLKLPRIKQRRHQQLLHGRVLAGRL